MMMKEHRFAVQYTEPEISESIDAEAKEFLCRYIGDFLRDNAKMRAITPMTTGDVFEKNQYLMCICYVPIEEEADGSDRTRATVIYVDNRKGAE